MRQDQRSEPLKDILAEVRVLRQSGKPVANIGGVDCHGFARAVLGLEAELLKQLFHHRLEPAGADVLEGFVDLRGDPGDLADRVGGDLEGDLLGADQRLVLLDEVRAGVAEDREGETVTVDAAYVRERLAGLAQDADLSTYVL